MLKNIVLLVIMQTPQILHRLPDEHVASFCGDFLSKFGQIFPSNLQRFFYCSTAVNLEGWLASITGFQKRDRVLLYLYQSTSFHSQRTHGVSGGQKGHCNVNPDLLSDVWYLTFQSHFPTVMSCREMGLLEDVNWLNNMDQCRSVPSCLPEEPKRVSLLFSHY